MHNHTDTAGYFSIDGLEAVAFSAVYSSVYLGIAPSALTRALTNLSIDFKDFTFVDVGCGKGRGLLVAAEFPFRRLIGIEITAGLCEVARRNIDLRADWKSRISIVNEDATRFTYPDSPLVLFFYDPFYLSVLRRVLRNLERQIRKKPRPTYILYADLRTNLSEAQDVFPKFESLMKSFQMIREISETMYPFTAEELKAEPSGSGLHGFKLYEVKAAQ